MILGTMSGCTIVGVPVSEHEDCGHGHHDHDDYYVDAYVSIPYEVRALIADLVEGYSMPPVHRYGYVLYPVDKRDPYNLPSYVSEDFNGDGIYDYAYMFSYLSWSGSEWFLETKMLIVTSTEYGYALSLELDLGTVSGYSSVPIEEYWSIRLLEPGVHTISEFIDGIEIEESVILESHGIYLASIDPYERSIFYVEDTDVFEIAIDLGIVAKKRAGTDDTRSKRIIKWEKSTLSNTVADSNTPTGASKK